MLCVSTRLISTGVRFPDRRVRHNHIVCRCSTADKGGDAKQPEEGRSSIQDALADVMRLNMKKMEALDHLDSVTNDEKLKLIQKADEVCTTTAVQ